MSGKGIALRKKETASTAVAAVCSGFLHLYMNHKPPDGSRAARNIQPLISLLELRAAAKRWGDKTLYGSLA